MTPSHSTPDVSRCIDTLDVACERQFKGTPLIAELRAHIFQMRMLLAPKGIPNPAHGAPRPAGHNPKG